MGGAISANQAEGRWNEGGKGESIADHMCGGDMHTKRIFDPVLLEDAYYPSHNAVDFYHYYKEDIALFAEMGFKVFGAAAPSKSELLISSKITFFIPSL